MSDQLTVVLGGTGRTGRRVVEALQRDGHPVRAASRGGSGPGTVRFDWTDDDTWEAALTGATRLYLMAPDGTPVDPGFVARAVESGVRRIVLLSSGAVEEMGDQRLLDAERLVQDCGAEWTVLRPSWFDQNFDEGFFRPGVMAGEVVMPVGDLRQAFVDAGAVAAVAAAALTRDGHAGQVYEVRGPEALTFDEAVATIARVSGRRVRFVGDPGAYRDALTAAGQPGEVTEAELAAFAALRARGDDEPDDVVERLTGRPPTTFPDYAAAAAARGAWRD
ncbi:SDR family oxidoreductase [Blastococcus sp. TF02A-26]|uniref:SDR family oxidoreductase n=1 Tax=Blastococcus sp. TF02A-26 TaxID=2250577 RepID=UPI000DEA42A5|nr:NAD(P)H-binding protein [Blastococcus sp. TF02A-26]RBY85276.1 NmrA family transcriptional regulator [Blastococcus sp. TF02A-26]